MIGNDIVDLQYSTCNSSDRLNRMAKRILAKSEYDFWQDNERTSQLLWAFWALKESAYKVNFQHSFHRFFAPKKFYCTHCSKIKKAVEGQPYRVDIPMIGPNCFGYGYVSLTTEFVHAFLILDENPSIHVQQKVFKIPISPELQSKVVRDRVTQYLAKKFQTPKKDICWSNNQGIPSVITPGQPKPIKLSLSHHQHWGAFAMVC